MRELREQRELPDAAGRPMRLEYYLLAGPAGCGVEAVLRREAETERYGAASLVSSEAEAGRLLALLAAGAVTPCTLPEVLEDLKKAGVF